MGRDVFSRVLFGAWWSVGTSVLVIAGALLIGVPIGLFSGAIGGWVDDILMRLVDIFLAFPSLLLALAIGAALGPSLEHAAIAIVIAWWPWYARLMRGEAASIRGRAFIESGRLLGISQVRLATRHILPNAAGPVIVQASLDLGGVILDTGWSELPRPGRARPCARVGPHGGTGSHAIPDASVGRHRAGRGHHARRAGIHAAGRGSPRASRPEGGRRGDDESVRGRPLLTIRDLRVEIGGTVLLDIDVLEADRAEIIGLVGESGAGKSLLQAAILGVLPATARISGSIRFDGIEISAQGCG